MAKLNLIFALSSLLLLGVTGAMVMYDYVRGWKWFQLEFMRIQSERLEQDLRAAKETQNKEQLSDLDKQVKQQEVVIAQHRAQYLVAQKELDGWEGKHYAADQDYRFAKAVLDAQRYETEVSIVQKLPDRAAREREYDRQTKHLNGLLLKLQDVTRSRDGAQANVNTWLKKIKDAEDKKKELNAKLDSGQMAPDKREDAEKRVEELKRIQDAPTDILNPFRTHPRMEMFVGSASPHPLLEFGCTACHRGQDRATEFGRAGHVPASPKMEKRWASTSAWTLGMFPTTGDLQNRHWGFESNPFLETPMYPRQYYEAGCIKC